MEAFILRYGLIALFLGAGIEGEPFALAGGVLAHRGWMSLPAAMAAAAGGSCAVDQLWFHLARHFRDARLVRSVIARPAFERSLALVERRPVWFVLGFRFAYGLRAVAPVAIGVSRVAAALFVPLNLVAAAIWGIGFTALGYRLGLAFEAAEARFGTAITVGAIAISLLALWWALRRER